MSPSAGRFARKNRITRAADYNQVFHSPCRSADSRFVVIARENGLGYARLGFAISRKRVNQAVARNRLKRLVRESFRIHQEMLSGLDVVVMTGKKSGICSNSVIFKSLQLHWHRLNNAIHPH